MFLARRSRPTARSLTLALALVAMGIVAANFNPGAVTASSHCKPSAGATATTGLADSHAGLDCPPVPGPDPAPQRSTYCDSLPIGEERFGGKVVGYTPDSVSMGLFRYADGREDTRFRAEPYLLRLQIGPFSLSFRFPGPLRTVLVKGGGTPTHEKYRIWCVGQVELPSGQTTEYHTKFDQAWVPLLTANAAAEGLNLFAAVQAKLASPQVELIDADADHGWLWVQVEHRVGIEPVAPVFVSATAGDPSDWATGPSVTAWVSATPVALTLRVESDAGEENLGSCDLASATNGGCQALFRHASSISPDGRFHGMATIEWKLASNAGILDGVGPIYTNREFSVEVAEAMAVTNE